jgi:hypothetical protein
MGCVFDAWVSGHTRAHVRRSRSALPSCAKIPETYWRNRGSDIAIEIAGA